MAGLAEPVHDEHVRRCRACGSAALFEDWAAGDRVCTNCGLVDEDHLPEQRAEWREFDDADDIIRNAFGGGGGAARSGLVASNEQLWVGGLQPTTLSKNVFGGPTRTSASTRKKLIHASRRLDKRMEKKHAQDVEDAKLSLQVRRKRQNRDEDEDNNNDGDTMVRPELESMLVHEEETALATTAALHADKWSLGRAIRLFGTGDEISSLATQGGEPQDWEAVRNSLDEMLTNAARDLYAAYTLLNKSANNLQLPERVTAEAATALCKYAARRDGLSVRGVASRLKQKNGKGADTAAEAKAREALSQFNKLKQMGSLVAAVLFYTSRNLSWPRSIAQVCASVETPVELANNPYLDVRTPKNGSNKNNSFVKKKHCSSAMNEIKQVFPDLTRTPSSGSQHCSDASTETLVDHMARKLRLPPVAEASLRALVAMCQENREDGDGGKDLDTKKRLAMCGGMAVFVCQMGEIMQNLAQQASAEDRPSRKRRKTVEPEKEDTSKEKSEVSDDLFSEQAAKQVAMEHRAYEMRRVWDAWREQTTWQRSLKEIEQVSGVSLATIESFFNTTIYPKRKELLTLLTEKSKNAEDGGGSSLRKVPLASVLLPHVAVTEPLLKQSVREKEAW